MKSSMVSSISVTQSNTYNIQIISVFIREAVQLCKCGGTCTDMKYGMRETDAIYWNENNTIRLEMVKPKMRVKREVLYTISDMVGKSYIHGT